MAEEGGSSVWADLSSYVKELRRQQLEDPSSEVVDLPVVSGSSASAEELKPSLLWVREVNMVSL